MFQYLKSHKQKKCHKYSSIINIIQSTISEMNLIIGSALDDNNISQQELEIITEHYEKYRDKIKEVQRCYSKKADKQKIAD